MNLILTAILVLIFLLLTSCLNLQTKEVERCVVSTKYDICRCHLYSILEDKRVSDSENHPIEYCDNGVVFRTQEDGAWTDIRTWLFELRQFVKDK